MYINPSNFFNIYSLIFSQADVTEKKPETNITEEKKKK